MKRGVVVERHRKYTIVLTRDGEFQKAEILDDDVSIGTEVNYQPIAKSRKSSIMSFRMVKPSVLAAAAACSLFLFVFPLYLFSENQTYAYVTIDINPSIELEIDEELRVKDLHALNDDAEHIMKNLEDFQNEPVETVIHKITKVNESTGNIQHGNHMIVGISYAEESKADADLMGHLEAYFTTNMEGWNVATLLIPEDIREVALEKEASMNEVMAAQLMDEDVESESMETLNEEDKEIINTFYRYEQKEKSDNTEEVGMREMLGPIKETLGRQASIPVGKIVNSEKKQLPGNSDQGAPDAEKSVAATAQTKPEQKGEQKQESHRTEAPPQRNNADNTSKAAENPNSKAPEQAEKEKQKSEQKAAKQPNGKANENGKQESGKGKGKGKEEPQHGPGNGKKHGKDNKDHKEKQNNHGNKHNEPNEHGKQMKNSQGPPHKDQKKNNKDQQKHKDHQHGKK